VGKWVSKREKGSSMAGRGSARIASRHHTTEDQVKVVCRLLARQIDSFLLELDECPGTFSLRDLADDLHRAGGESEGFRVLRLVTPDRAG
jgi:hypothetical protein